MHLQLEKIHFLGFFGCGFGCEGLPTLEGPKVEEEEDSLIVEGCSGTPNGDCRIDAAHDHRIAMSFLVLGCQTERPIEVSGAETIETSFPGFATLMNSLGANIQDVT